MDLADQQKLKRDAALVSFQQMAALKNSGRKRLWSMQERRRTQQEFQTIQLEYVKSLPPVEIARCPFDHNIVTKTMDIYGIDGPWWDVNSWDLPLAGDPHVITYSGALTHAQKLVEKVPPGLEILIGPERPYVIPRLLESGAVCVIALVEVLTGAYLMTYFADPPLPGVEGAEPWLRKIFYYIDETGNQAWNGRSDPWDFDIAKWIDAGKVYWIAPGDASLTVVKGKAAECPYVGLEGAQTPRSLTGRGIAQMAMPREQNVIHMFD